MLIAASVCPQPPLLLPELSAAAPDWLARLRAACAESVAALVAAAADTLVVVGSVPVTRVYPGDAAAALGGFGVEVRAGGGGAPLPYPLAIGAWLLDRAGWQGDRAHVGIASDATPGECAALGAEWGGRSGRVAMLVLGDGSACHGADAPGGADARAEAFDTAVVKAIAHADVAGLLDLDPVLARELKAAGRSAWQVLAGAAAAAARPARSGVRYHEAPLGVGYVVADWLIEAP